jgi:hypothetical protein
LKGEEPHAREHDHREQGDLERARDLGHYTSFGI